LCSDEEEPRNSKTYGHDPAAGFFGLRSASTHDLKRSLLHTQSGINLKPHLSTLNLKIPRAPIEQSHASGIKWQAAVSQQLTRFKSDQQEVLIPKRDPAPHIQLLKQTTSVRSFSNKHPQFLPINCDPYTKERVLSQGKSVNLNV
jgi:hypothetical protein